MRTITMMLLLVTMTGLAQIKGNGTIITKSFDIDPVQIFELNMYATVILDAALPSSVQFVGESNMLGNIDFEVVDGKLNLQQKEWIEPTKTLEIRIGVPELRRVEVGAHKTLRVVNVDQEALVLTALIGSIEASGMVKTVNINTGSGKIDAGNLKAQNVVLNIWGNGIARVNAKKKVTGKLSKEGKLSYARQPESIAPGIKRAQEKTTKAPFKNAKYITFKIKNNSWNRTHFVVRGPKPDGRYFGYGFPMMPGAVKKERWTVGTKIYKKGLLGKQKLLAEITALDEGKIVELFKD